MRFFFTILANAPWADFLLARSLARNPKRFREFIYTSAEEAASILEKRRNDDQLRVLVEKELRNDLPQPLTQSPRSILFRQIATPNFETRHFLEVTQTRSLPKPLFWEYRRDKFTNHNEFKHSLCKMLFWGGRGKKGGHRIDKETIIEFNTQNGLKLQEIKTLAGETLPSFHHWLFERSGYAVHEEAFFDASTWFNRHGKKAQTYYEPFMMLFIRDGILFENFLLNEREGSFTRTIFLPAFLRAYRKTGRKPIVVALVPEDSESDQYWYAHPAEMHTLVKERALPHVVS